MKRLILSLLVAMAALNIDAQCCSKDTQVMTNTDSMIVRIAELEIHPEYIKEYLDAAAEIGGISVREEPGVICIFPMQMKEDSTQVRIIEIYRSPSAYKSHLKTKHFLKYKTGTLHMVKSLKLPDMRPLDPKAMPEIFIKMNK